MNATIKAADNLLSMLHEAQAEVESLNETKSERKVEFDKAVQIEDVESQFRRYSARVFEWTSGGIRGIDFYPESHCEVGGCLYRARGRGSIFSR